MIKSERVENVVPLAHQYVKLTNSFLAKRQRVVHHTSIPYQLKALNDSVPSATPSHAIQNFKIAAGETNAEFGGRVFQDSDVYKWLEAVGFYLGTEKNHELEQAADDIIHLIGKAQQPDGYVNTYFTVKAPHERWTNLRDLHELYCAGHMFEAAVSYYNGTGKRTLLDIACKFADYIETVFGKEPGKLQGYDGHEEIELALVKLYQATGERRYLELSQFFINERGQTPHFFDSEEKNRPLEATKHDYSYYQAHLVEYDYSYFQAHEPVRNQETADGHAVRAMYLYSGMMDIALHMGDETLYKQCKILWENIVQKRMYITGGIGSIAHGEAFTFDYDLPNDKAYTETCAAIGLLFFAHRMLQYEINSQYADVMERVLFNGALSGISLDGTKYFYVNPLEVWPESIEKRRDNYKKRLRATRQEWYGTACCPPNIARLISSIGQYMYSHTNNQLFIHLYASSEANIMVNNYNVQIVQQTNYPWDENIHIDVNPEKVSEFEISLRIPGWCRKAILTVNGEKIDVETHQENGYITISREWNRGDQIHLQLAMPVEKIASNINVRVNAGKIALQRGPVIYCLEEIDNGANLPNLSISKDAEFNTYFDPNLLGGVTVIETEGVRDLPSNDEQSLYQPYEPKTKPAQIKAVPYFSWCNRTPGEMLVWVRVQ